MAPEVLQSLDYDGKADIWSLGITAIELAVGEPPHSNVHPMRAIFLIPTSEPPTLPDPSKASKDFNDFLKACLHKDPTKRPSAEQLLKSNPFIVKSKSKKIIAELVEECMQEIDAFREQEAHDQDNKTDVTAGTMDSDISTLDTGTMKGGTADVSLTPSETGTMLSAIPVRPDPNQDKSGTMIAPAKPVQPPQKPEEKVETAKGPVQSQSPETKQQTTTTTVANAAPAAILAARQAKGNFYYREARSLAVNKESNAIDLRAELITLNNAYDEEMKALEKFYADKRAALQQLLSKPQRVN
jgi:serine/threonine protein kinase